MRRLGLMLLFLFPMFVFADEVKYSSALNIPTPTYQVKNHRFNGFYVGFNAGIAFPGGKNADQDFNLGYDLTPQVGYQYGQGRVEFAPIFTDNQPGRSGVTAQSIYAYMFNGYYDFPYSAFPITPRLTPYFGIGFGWMNESGGNNSEFGPNNIQWGYQFILGMTYRITINWYAQADYHLFAWPQHKGYMNLINAGFTYHFL